MSLFRKKPVIIEARQLTDGNRGDILRWTRPNMTPDAYRVADIMRLPVIIPTLEGEMEASVGDWIIKGIKGEFYPCKPDIFVATYEAVI